MPSSLVSTDSLLVWHDWASVVAYSLLAGLLISVALYFAIARSESLRLRRLRTGSLRTTLIVSLIVVGVIPALALDLLLAGRSAHMRKERMAARVEESVIATANAVNRFIDKHHAGITSAASTMSASGRFDAESLTDSLLLYHEVYDDFLTMLATDEEGNIRAATSRLNQTLDAIADLRGFNVADRDYFSRPMATGSTFVSDAFRGRSLGRDPIVAISAALRDSNGRRIGVVEGSLDLGAFELIDEERTQLDDAVMIIVDHQDRVIYASRRAGLPELESIAGSSILRSGVTARVGASYDYAVSEDGRAEHYVAAYAPTDRGWKVLIEAPVQPIARQMFADYRVGAALLLVTICVSLLLGLATVRRVSGSVDAMNHAVSGIGIEGASEPIRTPPNTPTEFRPFFELIRKRSAQLEAAYARLSNSVEAGEALRRELTQAISRKDAEIAERTAELEAANRELLGESKRDALTGIPNRREYDAFVRRVWRQGLRENTPVAILLADVDLFKIFNDTLGHQAGDDCLRRVADALNRCARRPLDLVARYGGEEFVAVLGGSSIRNALVVADRMRRSIEGLQISHPGSRNGVVTVSIGVAAAVPGDVDGADELLRAADEALYYAKAAGRNCVVSSRDGEFVTYDQGDIDLGATNVLKILSSGSPASGG